MKLTVTRFDVLLENSDRQWAWECRKESKVWNITCSSSIVHLFVSDAITRQLRPVEKLLVDTASLVLKLQKKSQRSFRNMPVKIDIILKIGWIFIWETATGAIRTRCVFNFLVKISELNLRLFLIGKIFSAMSPWSPMAVSKYRPTKWSSRPAVRTFTRCLQASKNGSASGSHFRVSTTPRSTFSSTTFILRRYTSPRTMSRSFYQPPTSFNWTTSVMHAATFSRPNFTPRIASA